MTWIYVAVGVASLLALQMLRGALSLVFPIYHARPVRRPDATRFGGLELVDEKTAPYQKLGFSGPAWVGSDERATLSSDVAVHATFRNPDDHIVAWLGPTIDIGYPHQLHTYYTTALEDGRYAVTQVADTYFQSVDDARTPAQTIRASDEASEIEAHRRFVESLGVRPARSTPAQDVLRFAGEHMTAIRSRLLERGLICESDGVARPSLGFAVHLLRVFATRPTPEKRDSDPEIPAARLGFLASKLERNKQAAPSQSMQWLLLAISAALSILIGWPLLGLELTLIIVAVIMLHEGGHWLAMRLAGYRNPHITLLPLVGGVTIGHENDPSAARRAWVALAGPLPGILIGWLLLSALYSTPEAGPWNYDTAFTAVFVLLFINYLNVLPIPPLDGSHVVQAILPPRWVVLQILLIALGTAAGAYVAWLLDFWPLALIALLQLAGVRSLWRRHRFICELRHKSPPNPDDEPALRAWLIEWLQQKLGAPANAAKRIGLASAILSQLRLRPLRWGQRAVISGIYGALLVVPIAAMLLISTATSWDGEISADPALESAYADLDAAYEVILAESRTLSVDALVDELFAEYEVVAPASDESMGELARRLGGKLPANLDAFYRKRNGGLELLALGRAEDVRPVDNELFTTGELGHYVFEGRLGFWDDTLGERFFSPGETADWWLLGKADDRLGYAFVDPDARPGEPELYVIGDAEAGMYLTVDDWLREIWAIGQYEQVYADHYERIADINRARVADLSVTELMDLFPRPPFVARLVAWDFEPASPPASMEDIAMLEKALGRDLPDDHREALEFANGYPPASLLGTADIRPSASVSDATRERVVDVATEADIADFGNDDLDACWIIGGRIRPAYEDVPEELYPTLLWCPDNASGRQYLSLDTARVNRSFTDALRDLAATLTGY